MGDRGTDYLFLKTCGTGRGIRQLPDVPMAQRPAPLPSLIPIFHHSIIPLRIRIPVSGNLLIFRV
jgi:hypothetical protein